jgi:hypothetical protein
MFNFSSFRTVFCDSKEALDWAYSNGLPVDAKILTSSPAMLWDKKNNIKNIESHWEVNKFKEFQSTIYQFSIDVYEASLKAKNISHEKAIAVTQASVFFHSVLYKAACLSEIDITEPRLVINVKTDGDEDSGINPPWDDLLVNNDNLSVVTYEYNSSNWKKLNTSSVSWLRRLKVVGFETILYKLFVKYTGYLPKFLFRGTVLVVKDNELIVETVSAMALKRYQVKFIDIPDKENSVGEFYKNNDLEKQLCEVLRRRIDLWACPTLRDTVVDMFFNSIYKNILDVELYYSSWKKSFRKYSSKNTLVFINSPCNVTGLSLSWFCRENNIPVISAQHGITKEIAASQENEITYEVNCSDYVLTYNREAKKRSDSCYFSYGNSFVSGISARHARMKSKKYNNKQAVCFISTNLYKGNISTFDTWKTDYGRAIDEQKIIDKVLSKVPYDICYKTYPEENRRYTDPDPIINYARLKNNIKVYRNKVDMRYLISEYRIFITSGATSTIGWPIMSGKPLIFINNKYSLPIKPSVYKDFEKSIFCFDMDCDDFYDKLLDFLLKPFDEIEYEWQSMKKERDKMIKKYFTSYSRDAGKRSADFLHRRLQMKI